MTKKGDEAELIANAKRSLGDDVEVLAAGVFGCQDLVVPEVAGQMAGALAGSAIDGVAGSAAGVLIGGLAAKKAAAEAQGSTLKLVVAVTPTRIHIMNWGEGSAEDRHDLAFDRSRVEIEVKKFGWSRLINLRDPDTGATFHLHGSAAPFTSQTGPDQQVADVLSAA